MKALLPILLPTYYNEVQLRRRDDAEHDACWGPPEVESSVANFGSNYGLLMNVTLGLCLDGVSFYEAICFLL